ncbi:MAG TPA: hypothetical protein VGK97_04640 [Spongiibacteraceae bacterium]
MANETNIGESVKPRTQAAAGTVHQGIDKAAQVLHDSTDTAIASVDRLAESADRGRAKLRGTEEQARQTVVDYSQQHPFRALALGFGIGFLLAKLTGRRY